MWSIAYQLLKHLLKSDISLLLKFLAKVNHLVMAIPNPNLQKRANPPKQGQYWSEQPFPSPWDLPNSGIEPMSPALQVDSLPSEPPAKPSCFCECTLKRAQGRCTGTTLRDAIGGEVGGGFRMGDTCTPMADSCECMAKTTTIL